MKKFILFILSIALILGALPSCSLQENTYIIRQCGYSDSIEKANTKIEYDLWSSPLPNYENIPQEITVEFNGESFNGVYTYSSIYTNEYYPTHQYRSKYNKGYIRVNPFGEITEYTASANNKAQDDSLHLPEQIYIDIAKKLLENRIDTEDYVIDIQFYELADWYVVDFRKYVNGFRTADWAGVALWPNGELAWFQSKMLGKISGENVPDFDVEKIYASIEDKLDVIYADSKEYYDEITYKNEEGDLVLTMLSETEYALVFGVSIDCRKGNVHSGDRISFVVTVE